MKAVLEYVLKTLTEKGELICSETPVLTKKDPKQKDGIMTRGRSCTINDTQVKKTKISIAYGEITSFKMGELYSIFSQFTNFDKNSVFIDVGSGHGKAVYQMAALANCTSYGIEAFLSRYQLSIEMMDLKNYPPTLH